MRRLLATAAAFAALATPASAAPSLVPLGAFDSPVWAGAPAGDKQRVFVAERGGGIAVIRDGAATTFMTVPRVLAGGERGLLSLAFPPDHALTGKFYAYVTAAGAGDIEVREYTGADPASERVLVTIPHPRSNHNGGQLQFGPDGRLYAGTGDGGGRDDEERQAQDLTSRLGKMLRIDVATGTTEIVSRGLRNPWRFSFAPDGRIVIADVGQEAVEEINVGLAADYGWPCFEGSQTGPRPDAGCATGSAMPAVEHPQTDGFCSITGGYVVRDPGLPTLHGDYVYGDLCKSKLRAVDLADPTTARELDVPVSSPSSFGEDGCGRLLVVSLEGAVSRLTDGESTPCADEPGEPEEPTPTPTEVPTETPAEEPVETPTASPLVQPAAATPAPTPVPRTADTRPCTVSMRISGQRQLAKRRYLSIALRTDKPCRVTISAPSFRRVTVRLQPGPGRVVKLRRAYGTAKRISVLVRGPGADVRQTVRAG
ncbi:PQQ-dependent sugar dehydrogenase [Solirubrobacter sp. CPCC 204708]|uniref:PQQ-dependent sugar dehydrogenase n=1 Tax=Solirubrobacter deserti TaxID=2282478 RepID=A0ABT4RL11_9ACTN|nr:PQQ-dependent sugar dehydrogenase [Solirubrobacter deserti]MBE2319112.1 PQQ-dependent sugar dehydrogenase [Solirubrobacter deserti]MDA0139190.1 PQQ-dependent sugar dehydrogenase [Solirubrobacter deserti]